MITLCPIWNITRIFISLIFLSQTGFYSIFLLLKTINDPFSAKNVYFKILTGFFHIKTG
jgi:hypothetical protein